MDTGTESNPGSESTFTILPNGEGWVAVVMRAVHGVFPRKTADILAHLTGRDPRTAKNWRSTKRGMTADDLIALLRDNAAGPVVRNAILAGAEWHETERAMLDLIEAQQKFEAARADVQRRQEAQRLKHPRK